MEFSCLYFDGKSSEGRAAQLRIDSEGTLTLILANQPLVIKKGHYSIPARLANLPISIELTEGGVIQLPVSAHLGQLLDRITASEFGWLHSIESSYRKIFACVGGAVVAIWLAWALLIPALATAIAPTIPMAARVSLGEQIIEFLDKWVLSPSALTDDERRRVDVLARRLMLAGERDAISILTRKMDNEGANAMAVPPNTIIFTDQLVRTLSDAELQAVAAHELGHLDLDHGMINLVRGSLLTIAGVLVLGEVIDSDVVVSLALGFLNSSYSRSQELEADEFAVHRLVQHSLPPEALGSALQKIAPADDQQRSLEFLSSHPSTPERIERIRKAHESTRQVGN